MTVRELKKGEFFTKWPFDEPTEDKVWVRGEYNRASKKYECHRFDDVCHTQELKGDRVIYTDFTF